MVNQSIIVYRNPLEAAVWEGLMPVLPYLAMIALAIIVPMVLWTVIKAMLPNRPNRNYPGFGNSNTYGETNKHFHSLSDL